MRVSILRVTARLIRIERKCRNASIRFLGSFGSPARVEWLKRINQPPPDAYWRIEECTAFLLVVHLETQTRKRRLGNRRFVVLYLANSGSQHRILMGFARFHYGYQDVPWCQRAERHHFDRYSSQCFLQFEAFHFAPCLMQSSRFHMQSPRDCEQRCLVTNLACVNEKLPLWLDMSGMPYRSGWIIGQCGESGDLAAPDGRLVFQHRL